MILVKNDRDIIFNSAEFAGISKLAGFVGSCGAGRNTGRNLGCLGLSLKERKHVGRGIRIYQRAVINLTEKTAAVGSACVVVICRICGKKFTSEMCGGVAVFLTKCIDGSCACTEIPVSELTYQFVGRVVVTDGDHTGKKWFQSTFIVR